MAVDSEALADTRDIVYVICTLIQTIFGLFFIGYFWDKRKRKKDQKRQDEQREEDRKRQDKQREEDQQKADADNLAAVLGQNFDKVERIFDRFDKKVVKLGEKKITHRFSEHDVLVYMCHPDNQETFAKPNGMDMRMPYAASNQETFPPPNQSSHNTRHGMEMGTLDVAGMLAALAMLAAPNQSNDTSTYGIKQVLSDVDSIMKLFIEFRLKLSLIHNKTCPKDIKDGFSSEIKKMGQAIYPFVSVPRKKVIKLALKYFDPELTHADQQERGTHTQPHTPTGSESQPEPRTHNSIPRPSDECNTDAIPPSNNHPNSGLSEIKNEIPYIEFLQYNDGNIDCNIPCKYSNLQNLEEHVRQGETEIMHKKDEIQERIRMVLDGHQVPEQQTASSETQEHIPEQVLQQPTTSSEIPEHIPMELLDRQVPERQTASSETQEHIPEQVLEQPTTSSEIPEHIPMELLDRQVPERQTASSETQEHIPEQQTASSNQIYLLHLIRIVMLKIHKRELNDDNISEFIEYVRGVDCHSAAEGLTLLRSEREVCEIEALINQLKNDHQVILGYEQTPEFLRNTAKEISKFIKDQLPRTQT